MGKDWAKGLTATSDPRVARCAAAHIGLRYRPRSYARVDIAWSSATAYGVGLIATDGCLYRDGRHVSFGSEDHELVVTLLQCLGKHNRIEELRTRNGTAYYRVQLGDVNLYRWLVDVGLTPRKSLTLGALAVPELWLIDVARDSSMAMVR